MGSFHVERLPTLPTTLAALLQARRATLATAESCTGGWVAKALTDRPGSSAWFMGGIVCYSNQAKQDLLGVPAAMLAEHGAVSEPVVQVLAAEARRRVSTCGYQTRASPRVKPTSTPTGMRPPESVPAL